jgi:hypothetical protein
MVILLFSTLGCIPAEYGEQAPEERDPMDAWSVEEGTVQSCAEPMESVSYTESGLLLGVDTEWFDPAAPGGHEDGPSLAVGDPNADGLLDLIVARMANGQSHIYQRQPAGFVDFEDVLGPSRSPLMADVDQDGRMDVLLAGPNPMWARFDEDLNPQIQAMPAMEDGESASVVHDWTMADFDGRPGMEVLAVRTASPFGQGEVSNDRMFSLTEDGPVLAPDWVPESVGLRHGFDAVSFDEDGDGDPDVYMVHDHGATVGPSTLLLNQNGSFEDAAPDCFCSISASAKGVDIADLDGDGRPELFVTGAPLNTLLSRTEDGWVDRSDASGVRDEVSLAAGWGGVFFDLGNDGQQDLLLAQGDRWNPGQTDLPDGSPAVFDEPLHALAFRDGAFVDAAAEIGLDVQGSFRAVVATDLNDDGVEDLVVTQVADRTLVFLSDGCTAANWIRVDAPVGAKVEVATDETVHTGWSRVGRGFQSTARVPLHFGLGTDSEIHQIRVHWGGMVFEAAGPFEARQTITVRGPAPLVSGRE